MVPVKKKQIDGDSWELPSAMSARSVGIILFSDTFLCFRHHL